MRKIVLWGLAFIASLYVGAIFFLYMNQRALQYEPGEAFSGLDEVQVEGAELVSISTGKFVSVRGWYVAPEPGKPVIAYLKGNEGSFSSGHARFAEMSADGYGLIAFDYRGFPMSPGEISQDNILADSLAVFDWAAGRGAGIVIWGRSLGSGPATYIASKREAVALILETPFTAAVDVAAERYPLLPVSAVMKDQYRVRDWIGDVDEPVFIAHGTADMVIGVHHGQDLFAKAMDGRDLWIADGGTHGDLWGRGLWDRAKLFIGGLVPPGRD